MEAQHAKAISFTIWPSNIELTDVCTVAEKKSNLPCWDLLPL
jgi:hypothetical protein